MLIVCGVVTLITLVFVRETCRSIVGDGSVPPQKWNRSLVQLIRQDTFTPDYSTLKEQRKTVNPLRAVGLLRDKVNLIVVLSGGLVYAGYVSVTAILASQLHARYGYNQVVTGLCYLPVGFGSLSSRFTSAVLTDWNFKREARKQGAWTPTMLFYRHKRCM